MAGGAPDRDCGALIDDMEDGSGRICRGAGRAGVWYAFRDEASTQWPERTAPGTPIEPSVLDVDREGSRRAIHTYGTAAGWGAGVGFDLAFDGKTYALYDATRYRGIEFWARGTKTAVTVRLSSKSGTSVQYGGSCTSKKEESDPEGATCAGPIGPILKLGPEWRRYTVPFAELPAPIQDELDSLSNIQFKVGYETAGSRFYPAFDFWIDDVRFLEEEPDCCADLPACRGGVTFADPELDRVARGAGPEPLSCARACSLRSLLLPGLNIHDLGGLECLTALDSLSIGGNQIRDLGALAELAGLRELDLGQNQIEDLTPLTGLENLAGLSLAGNRIEDVTPLAGLTHLDSLDLGDNPVADIIALAPLDALTYLSLSRSDVADVSALTSLVNLAGLNLSGTQVSDVAALVTLQKLTTLNLSNSRVGDASPLSRLAQLTTLDLSTNEVTDLGELLLLPNLARADLSHNRLESVGVSRAESPLLELNLSFNQLRDPTPLGMLSKLHTLLLSDNRIEDFAGLTNAALNRLVLARNSITRAPDPFLLQTLTSLDLSENEISELPSLAGMKFYGLLLAHNQLSSVQALAGITLLATGCDRCGSFPGVLDLADNRVSELAPLIGQILGQASVNLSQNPISCAEQASNLAAMRAAGIDVVLEPECP